MPSLNDLHSFAVSVLRLGRGLRATRVPPRLPAAPLELFEFEACPFCRKVREALSELDVDYISRPCARGSNNREHVQTRGGKVLFPFLVDPSGGRALYESEDIITYVAETYGGGRGGLGRAVAPLNTFGAALASLARRRGGHVRPGCGERAQPQHLLELWSFEASPYCRKVRETLCELNLDYRVHNVAKRGSRRPELVARGGKMQVPYLVDPNTQTAMYESDDIVAYLERTYGG